MELHTIPKEPHIILLNLCDSSIGAAPSIFINYNITPAQVNYLFRMYCKYPTIIATTSTISLHLTGSDYAPQLPPIIDERSPAIPLGLVILLTDITDANTDYIDKLLVTYSGPTLIVIEHTNIAAAVISQFIYTITYCRSNTITILPINKGIALAYDNLIELKFNAFTTLIKRLIYTATASSLASSACDTTISELIEQIVACTLPPKLFNQRTLFAIIHYSLLKYGYDDSCRSDSWLCTHVARYITQLKSTRRWNYTILRLYCTILWHLILEMRCSRRDSSDASFAELYDSYTDLSDARLYLQYYDSSDLTEYSCIHWIEPTKKKLLYKTEQIIVTGKRHSTYNYMKTIVGQYCVIV
jgi:hypothetical protein